MTHEPARPVVAAAALLHHAMNLKRADAFLRLQHHVGDFEPSLQRDLRVHEDRPDQWPEAITLWRTLLALPAEGLLELVDFLIAAARTRHAIGPAQRNQIFLAGIFGRELAVKSI